MGAQSNFDELNWVNQIRKTLNEEHECHDGDDEDQIYIFNVPKALMMSDPHSFTPQKIAIGPYHYNRPGLYEMERYKLAAAKRMQKKLFETVRFQTLVDQLANIEQKIRGYYHKFLDFNGETLAWRMTMDACFLLEFLQIYEVREGKISSAVSSRMSRLVDYAGRRCAHNAILRDIIMLENQIPLFIVTNILESQYSSPDLAEGMLTSMLKGICNELIPFKTAKECSERLRFRDAPHLLALLYHMIVPKMERSQSDASVFSENSKDEKSNENTSTPFIKRVMYSRPGIFFQNLPLKILPLIPAFSILSACPLSEPNPEENSTNIDIENQLNLPPSVEELRIPSVTELARSGVKFSPISGGISAVHFDEASASLKLPIVTLDVNSDVVMRNIVAYEASSASGPLIFTRYTELMNGIIDTKEDAKVMRECGVVRNHLKSDADVADLWNGMSKSIRLTKVVELDKVIEDVNRYYEGRWRVRIRKFMSKHVFESWQFLTFVAGIWLLILITVQLFCSIFFCRRDFTYVSL